MRKEKEKNRITASPPHPSEASKHLNDFRLYKKNSIFV